MARVEEGGASREKEGIKRRKRKKNSRC